LDIPADLSGQRVLDIGCYEGFFSFECERRGAEVLAIDLWEYGENGFKICKELLGSQVQYRQASVYDLEPDSFGQFDLVLFAGVLYHLRHPLLALDRVRTVCRGMAIVETQICDEMFVLPGGGMAPLRSLSPTLSDVPLAQFYPGAELAGDPSNWFSPNLTAFVAWVNTSGFKADRVISNGVRACVHAALDDPVVEVPAIFSRK
jgi:tRNA (mo5U34)-methyltransferase